MTKLKFFLSILKEREWLEQMAAEGWLLQNMTMGIFYHFRQIEPSAKVYEIDRFSLSKNPKKGELTARQMAMDIAQQSGWKVVTHDEDMNYYFVKDKMGDESDEFYNDENIRRERADKYRRHYCIEQPRMLLGMWLAVSVLYVILFLITGIDEGLSSVKMTLLWFYIIASILEISSCFCLILCGEKIYEEMLLSREQWELRRRYVQKRSFCKSSELTAFLAEQDKKGLVFTDCQNDEFFFEQADVHYDYCVDTKKALQKRLKAKGIRQKSDKKDWYIQSTQWHETSIREAEENGMELVCALEGETLLYRKVHEPDGISWETGARYMGLVEAAMQVGIFWLVFILICFCVGFAAGFLFAAIF